MRPRLGLGLDSAGASAVIAQRGQVMWQNSVTVDATESLEERLFGLLAAAPLRRTGLAVVAIGPSFAQVKRLSGIPAQVTDERAVSQAVAMNSNRFFLGDASSLRTTASFRSGDAWWAAAIDEHVIVTVERVCNRVGINLHGFIPLLAALAADHQSADTACCDGSINATLTIRDGAWISIKRELHPKSSAPGIPREPTSLVAARAALTCGRKSPLFLCKSQPRRPRSYVGRVSLICAAFVSLALAMAARGLSASYRRAHAEQLLLDLRQAGAEWIRERERLSKATSMLSDIERFESVRHSSVAALASLSAALPDSTAVVSIRLDSAGGSLVLLSSSAAAVVPRLSKLTAIGSARVTGVVSRERVNGSAVQRVAIRFEPSHPN